MFESNRKILFILFTICLFVFIAGLFWLFMSYLREKSPSNQQNNRPKIVENATLNDVVPTNAKSSEEFLEKVKEKTDTIQKKYDSSLTEFSRKKWDKFFQESNNLEAGFFENNFQLISQEIQKTSDQSTIFKIKYNIILGGKSQETEDFYPLILSEAKIKELGLTNLKANVFLSDAEIKANINRTGFAKITKIQNLSPSLNGE